VASVLLPLSFREPHHGQTINFPVVSFSGFGSAALQRALADRAIEPGIVHHSDRGVQYASHDYVALLESHGFLISMSRTGNPYDNAKAESFMKTLKCEEVYLQKYRDREQAHASIAHFIEEVYNTKRLHSALGYLSPAAFEAHTQELAAPQLSV
jgi:transposase InsO family protein